MQLSYNVIKSDSVIANGNKEIITELDNNRNKQKKQGNIPGEVDSVNEEAMKAAAGGIIEEAKRQSDAIAREAYELAEKIKQEAYEAAYEEGRQQGFNEAYNETLPSVKAEGDRIIEDANTLLLSAKKEYEDYLEMKKSEIINLSINIAESILKKELNFGEGFNDLVSDVLNRSKNAESFIIKASALHVSELKERVNYWKTSLGLKGEVFVVQDNSLDDFNVVIEKSNGRIEIGIKAGMEAIKQALL